MNMNGMIGKLVNMVMRAGMDTLNRKMKTTPAKGTKPAAGSKQVQNSARSAAKRARQAAKITRRLGK